MNRIVVTGAAGQIGTEMVARLREEYGTDAVLATDIRSVGFELGPFAFVDVTNGESLDAAPHLHPYIRLHLHLQPKPPLIRSSA